MRGTRDPRQNDLHGKDDEADDGAVSFFTAQGNTSKFLSGFVPELKEQDGAG